MTFLLVTNKRDLTSDFIVRELQARKLEYYRLNTETISSSRIAHDPTSGEMTFRWADSVLNSRHIRVAYFRRPEPPVIQGQSALYREAEWNAYLKALYLLIDARWFTHPADILLAEDKIRQLRLAKELGFSVPATLVTNDHVAAKAFVAEGPSIGKVLKQALLKDGSRERVIFTTRISEITIEDADAIAACPLVLQREVPKKVDVRVTVVAESVFAVAIHSQQFPSTVVDWRRGSNPELKHEIVELPAATAAQCIALVKQQNLRFGAIDLVQDPDGHFWFLECNPNGQWAWIENRTGLPIAASIVDEMQRLACC